MIYELKFSYYEDNSENNDEIIIAVYSSYKKAEIGKKKFSQQPRFKGKEEFLEINEYKINEAEWNEGFWRATKSYFIIKLLNNYMIEKEEEYNPENHDIEVKYGENIKVYNGKMDYYYDHETTDENNNSVCFLINQGDRHFLFTGDLEKEGEARQEELALAYPSFLARLTLLAQTGMPIRQIFARLSKEKNGVVYEEVRRTFREMESGMTQTEALERFGKRTRLPQYKKCAALLAQNIRRGTGELITALGQEAENAFEEQKAAARRKAEEAQTKLLFPMLLMLSVVMILILVPAWLSFGGL